MPNPAEQLRTCKAQVQCLLTGAGNAFKSVTALQLTIHSEASPHKRRKQKPITGDPLLQQPVSRVAYVSKALCAMLAAAMPNLQRLTLSGMCIDVNLPVFGAKCPQLVCLQVEALTVPLFAIAQMHVALPGLTHFVLHSRSVGEGANLHLYVDTVIRLLSGCSGLRVLELDFGSVANGANLLVCCNLKEWENRPKCLDDLRCNLEMIPLLPGAPALFDNLRFLTVHELPLSNLPQLLQHTPLLERATVTGDGDVELCWLSNDDEEEDIVMSEDIPWYKEQLLGGFQFSCPNVTLMGPTEAVVEVMTWLSPLANTTRCQIGLPGTVPDPKCTAMLERLCPKVLRLSL